MIKPRFRGIFMVFFSYQLVRNTVVIWSIVFAHIPPVFALGLYRNKSKSLTKNETQLPSTDQH